MFRFFQEFVQLSLYKLTIVLKQTQPAAILQFYQLFVPNFRPIFVYVLSTNKQLGADWPTQRAQFSQDYHEASTQVLFTIQTFKFQYFNTSLFRFKYKYSIHSGLSSNIPLQFVQEISNMMCTVTNHKKKITKLQKPKILRK